MLVVCKCETVIGFSDFIIVLVCFSQQRDYKASWEFNAKLDMVASPDVGLSCVSVTETIDTHITSHC